MESETIYRIDRLLERYFDAQTTLAEEAELRELLRGDDLPERLRYARAMLGAFREEAVRRCPESAIRPGRRRMRAAKIHRWGWGVAAAAVLAVCAGVWALVPRTVYGYVDGIPLTDRRLAVAEVRRAMERVDEGLKVPFEKFRTVERLEVPVARVDAALKRLEINIPYK